MKLSFPALGAALAIIGALVALTVLFSYPTHENHTYSIPVVVVKPFNASFCREQVCSNSGTCFSANTSIPVEQTDEYSCLCDRWYFGANCSSSCPNLCSQRGDCVINQLFGSTTQSDVHTVQVTVQDSTSTVLSNSTALACVCDSSGYGGVDCGVTCPKLCSGHGNCSAVGTCFCETPWLGEACDLRCPNDCSGHGLCNINNTTGAPQCLCNSDYWGNDCSNLRTDCSHLTISMNTPNEPSSTPGTAIMTNTVHSDLQHCFWNTTTVAYTLTTPFGHMAIDHFRSNQARMIAPVPVVPTFWMSKNGTLTAVIEVWGTIMNSNWSFDAYVYSCGLGECPCNTNTGLCQCATDPVCYCVHNKTNLCNLTPPPTPIPVATRGFDFVTNPPTSPPTPTPQRPPPPAAPTQPMTITTLLTSSWKPEVPPPNHFPALFRQTVAPEEFTNNNAAVIFLSVLYSVYFVMALVLVFHHRRQKTHPVPVNQVEEPNENWEVKEKRSFCHDYGERFLQRHLILGICFAGKHDGMPRLARLTYLCCHILASLTVSAVWYGNKQSAGEFLTTGIITASVLTPFNAMMWLVLSRAGENSFQGGVAGIVSALVAAWCTYTCILISTTFGQQRAHSWLLAFLFSLALQNTISHAIIVCLMTLVHRARDKHCRCNKKPSRTTVRVESLTLPPERVSEL